MQFSFDTIAGLNKGNLDKLVKEGTLTRAEIDMKVKKRAVAFCYVFAGFGILNQETNENNQ